MKIYNKKEFLKLPEGTFFAKGIKWSMDGFCVKGQTLNDDFIYVNLVQIDADSSEELFDRYEDMLQNGSSYEINESGQRDGSFSNEDIFLVFEKEDIKKIINFMIG